MGTPMHESRSEFVAGLAVVGGLLAAMAVLINVASYNVAVAALVALVLVVVSYPVFQWLGRADDDPGLARLLMGALVAKFGFSLVRYWVVTALYGGSSDSLRYSSDGWLFARAVRGGSLFPAIPSIDTVEAGTRNIIKLTGYLFSVTGRSIFAGYFFYSWLAFLGCLLFARGARRAFPELDQRRYLLLVLFWPSLLFWPSSIGKDAVMLFFLGLAFYGASLLLGPRARLVGAVPFVAAAGGMLLVRDHVALMAALALAMALVFAFLGGDRAPRRGRRRVVRVAALVAVVVVASVASTQTARFFGEETGGATDLESALELTKERTQQGGSEIDPIIVGNVLDLPAATVSVVVRPFPWEVNSGGTALSAMEGAAVALAFVLSWRRLRRWPGSAWRRPILVFAAAYVLLFVVGFSAIGNAGILARQRVQMLPLLFLALAVPVTRWWDRAADTVESHDSRSTTLSGSAGTVRSIGAASMGADRMGAVNMGAVNMAGRS